MRTLEQFQKEMQEAHDCEKCHGKIFCVTIDLTGRMHCAYCNAVVNYPKATPMEIREWTKNTGVKKC